MTLLLFLGDDDRVARWQRLADGVAVEEGADTLPPPIEAPESIVAVAPADAVMLHSADLSGLAPAQARAAARLMVSENSIASPDALHVALAGGDADDRMIAVVSSGRMTSWLASLQALGIDPDAIVPAPLLLPRPDEGYARGVVGGAPLLRSHNGGLADDPAIGALIVGDAAVDEVSGARLDAAVAAAIADVELDLRQGPFARRRGWTLDWPLIRRLGWLIVAILTAALLISLARIARYDFAARSLDVAAKAVARRVMPEASADPVAALDARLATLRGGGLGFTATAGALFAAIEATPNIELATLDFDADGTLRATILAPGKPEADALQVALQVKGLVVEPAPFTTDNGRVRGEFRITAR